MLEDLIESFPAAIVVLNIDGQVERVNRRWGLFAAENDYRGDNFIGQNYLDVCRRVQGVERGFAEAVLAGFDELATGGTERFELVYPCHAPHEKRWFKLLMGRFSTGMILIHIDITAEYLSRTFLSDPSVMASAVHELRTPLNAIIGYSELIKEGVQPPKHSQFATDIHSSALVLLSLVNDLLDVSEVEAGAVRLHEDDCDVELLLRNALSLIQPVADKKRISVTASYCSLPHLRADPRRMVQIFSNLLNNSVKYSERGARISISAALDQDGGVKVVFSDTGHGIAPSEIERVLQPFGRSLSAQKSLTEGTGLGLPFAKRLVEMHDGLLTIDSAVGVGTTITVMFPRWRSIQRASDAEMKG